MIIIIIIWVYNNNKYIYSFKVQYKMYIGVRVQWTV